MTTKLANPVTVTTDKAAGMEQTKGFDLYTSLPWLTTYLGHSRITHTEYYLRLLEDHFEGILSQVESYSPDLYSSVEGGDDE